MKHIQTEGKQRYYIQRKLIRCLPRILFIRLKESVIWVITIFFYKDITVTVLIREIEVQKE